MVRLFQRFHFFLNEFEMSTVNYWLIWHAVGLLEIAELESGEPLGFDPDDETSTKAAFEKHVCPSLHQWTTERTERLMLSLAYFHSKEEILDDQILANLPELTMPEPENTSLFFRWLFEALFPDRDIDSIQVESVEEANDVMEANRTSTA